MDNQHQKITGYRDLNQAEIDLMNEGKTLGVQIGAFIQKLESLPSTPAPSDAEVPLAFIDKRWVTIGKTDMQTGLMALIRAIAKPTTF